MKAERPTIFQDAVTALRDRAGWTPDDFANGTGLPYHRLADLLPEQFETAPQVQVGLRRIK